MHPSFYPIFFGLLAIFFGIIWLGVALSLSPTRLTAAEANYARAQMAAMAAKDAHQEGAEHAH